ncbi:Pogo transposable element with ZNF domain [Holothuria leucospilota]|uniref:Pogo transposable element with ZNF domain n=1 Tax=Holothuria leucospilota TaxID=206669 RepID=A0A9Q1C024_HOLLE|nr:Pogo transposable element with ZNF domain [Holothuria leucospilota]
MQKMIGYAQPTSCQFSNTMDCNGNSWAHQQKDQHALEDRCPELAKLLDMDPQNSAIAQLQRVAANHLPDVSPGNYSLPKTAHHERLVAANGPQESRSGTQLERLPRPHAGSPSVCNNSVTTRPCQSGTLTSPSISGIKVSNSPVIPLQLKKVGEAQSPLQNGDHLQNGDVMRNERRRQSGWSSRRKRHLHKNIEDSTTGRQTEARDEKEMGMTKDHEQDSHTKRMEQPASPIDLQMSCDEDGLDTTQMKLNEEYAEALRKYQEEMARYREELEKHILAKHGLDEKRKAESSKGGPDDVILISRGVQASEVTERDTVIAPAIELDLASVNQLDPSSPDSRMVIPTTQTKMHLSHSAPRNRFQRNFGNSVTCTTASSDVLSPSGHQNTKSPLTESTLSPAMSSASSSQTPSPQSVNQNIDGQVSSMLQRDRKSNPAQMQQTRYPLSNASGAVQTNSLLNQGPPPLRHTDEVQTGSNHQQHLQPFCVIQPSAYPGVPPSMAIPGQTVGHPPPYATGQAAPRPPNQRQPSESGSSGSDLPPKGQGQGHSSKRRRRSSSGNRQAKRPKGQEVTQNSRVNVSQSGHTVSYRPEDQVTAHFEETYSRIMQRNAPFSPPNISVRHPWQHPIPPYSGGMSQNSQQPNVRPTHSLLRDHLTRQPMWPFGPPQQHQGTASRMPPFHQDFNQFSQCSGGSRMPLPRPPPPFHPESYNGHPPANHMGPYGGVERFDFHAGYRKQGDYQGMPPYLHGGGGSSGGSDKNQPTNHAQGPDSHLMQSIGQSSPTYLSSEGILQMYGGLQSSYRFPGFPMNGPPLMSRPDGLPNSTPTSEPHHQCLPARAQEGPNVSRDNTIVRNSPIETGRNFQPPQQDGCTLPASDNIYGSRIGQSCRFPPPERQQPSMTRKPVSQDDGKQSNSVTQPPDILDLSRPHEQEVMPQISKVHNVNRQRDHSDMRASPPESQQQEPVMPKIVSVTTERREPFPPSKGSFRDAVHHGRNQVVKTPCPPLVRGSQATAGQLPRSGTNPNKELVVPSIGSSSKTIDSAHSSGRPHHQPRTSQAAVSGSETTTLSQDRILSVPRLVRDERGLPRVDVCGDEYNGSLGVSLPSKHLSPSTHKEVSRGTNSVQPDVSTAQSRRDANQMETASSKPSSASVSSNHTSNTKQRLMPALLRIPKIRKVTGADRFATKDTNKSSSTATPTSGSSTITSEQRDAAGTVGKTTSTSLGEMIASCVSGKNVSMPVTDPPTSSPMVPPKILPNLVTSQVSSETHKQQQPAGTSGAFFAAFPSLGTQPPTLTTSTTLLSTGPATQQRQVMFGPTVPSLQTIPSLSIPTILAQPIVIPPSVSFMNSATVDQQNISLPTNQTADQPQPQVIAGTVTNQPHPQVVGGTVANHPQPQVVAGTVANQPQPQVVVGTVANHPQPQVVAGTVANHPQPQVVAGTVANHPQPQVVAGTVRSVVEQPAPQVNSVTLGLLRSRSQLEKYLDQTAQVASGVTLSGNGGEVPATSPPRINSTTGKEKDGSDDDQGNKPQNSVQKEVVTGSTSVTPRASDVVTAVHQETDESEEVITIPVASVLSSPEAGGSADKSHSKRDEDINIFDQVATFVSNLEKHTETSTAIYSKVSKETKSTPSHSTGPNKTNVQLNESGPKSATDGAGESSSTVPSGRLKNCTLRLVPRRRSGDEEKKGQGQPKPKHASQITKEKRRKDSHTKSSSSKEKVVGTVSSKWKKYYGFKKGKFPSHQHNTRFRVVCYHCENLMADNVTYMDHVEEVIEKSCPATKIKKLCKICFKAQTGDLQQHIRESHEKGSKYSCQICNINFPGRKDLKTHMKRTHQGLTMPYICKICLYQTSFHADLKNHFITTHRGSKALLCHFCTKVLYSSRSFLSHFTKHYSRQIGVQCPDCKLVFLSHAACKEHMNNDHQKFSYNAKDGLPPYKSFYLPKSSPQKTQGCKKLVGSMSSLSEEVVLVPDEEEEVKKAWKCLECGGSYVHLAEHLFTEYKCQNCPYVTHCSSAFTQHVVAFHSSFQDAPALHPVKKSRVFGGQLLRCRKCGFKTAFATNMAKHIVCCPEGVSVIDSFDYLRTRALKEIAMRGRIADNSDNVPEVIAVENID